MFWWDLRLAETLLSMEAVSEPLFLCLSRSWACRRLLSRKVGGVGGQEPREEEPAPVAEVPANTLSARVASEQSLRPATERRLSLRDRGAAADPAATQASVKYTQQKIHNYTFGDRQTSHLLK